MTIIQQRQYDRFGRSGKFIDEHKDEFTAGSQALTTREELKTVIDGFEAASQQQKPAGTGSRSYTSAKLSALNALREDLVRIAQTAEVIATLNSKFKNTFILPDRRRKNELAAAARQFIKSATPVKAEFEALEMKSDFLEQLKTRLDAYEAAQSGQGAVKGERAVASDPISGLVAEGDRLVGVLNVMVQNKYRGQNEVLEAWAEASNLEFTPRRKKGERAAEKASKKSA
jgi:hypothetical protein